MKQPKFNGAGDLGSTREGSWHIRGETARKNLHCLGWDDEQDEGICWLELGVFFVLVGGGTVTDEIDDVKSGLLWSAESIYWFVDAVLRDTNRACVSAGCAKLLIGTDFSWTTNAARLRNEVEMVNWTFFSL